VGSRSAAVRFQKTVHLQFHRQAVRDDPVARLPLGHPGARLEHEAGQVGPDDVVGQVVALAEFGRAAVALEEPERGDRLEDRGPHGVVV